YAYFLKRYTTTGLSPDQIHEIGLQQVARIEKEMDTIFRRLGRTAGSVRDRIEKLKDDLRYPETEEGRKRIMADVEQILRDSERRSALLFDQTPKAPVVAQPYPRFREANAAVSYNDPEGLLGQLDAELFRARRLVVDTGIHAKHWTRQQAIGYGIEPSEVERYVVYPGQACAYMLGELKIIELREKAQKTLRQNFAL